VIAVIDYKAGNAPSVMHAIKRLGLAAQLARTSTDLEDASHIILPGVGSAAATMKSLAEQDLLPQLTQSVRKDKVPFLGICVGLQVLFEHSEEGEVDCLAWLPGRIARFDSSEVRVPQMGWNEVNFVKETPVKATSQYFYFVNSYYAEVADQSDLWGTANYGAPFTAAVNRDNIYGTQFHVEKSGEAGLALLNNFLNLPSPSPLLEESAGK